MAISAIIPVAFRRSNPPRPASPSPLPSQQSTAFVISFPSLAFLITSFPCSSSLIIIMEFRHCCKHGTQFCDDILHEILKHLDAASLASASCVNRQWRKAAQNESLWEAICCTTNNNWSSSGSSGTGSSYMQQLKSVVMAMGGFRRLYVVCLRPLSRRPSERLETKRLRSSDEKWSKDEIHLSLSLFSIDCYERLGLRAASSPSSLDLLWKAASSPNPCARRKTAAPSLHALAPALCRALV